eukprot:2577677-Rhodomonas_salina.2
MAGFIQRLLTAMGARRLQGSEIAYGAVREQESGGESCSEGSRRYALPVLAYSVWSPYWHSVWCYALPVHCKLKNKKPHSSYTLY